MVDVEGDGGEEQAKAIRHFQRLGLARLFRLVTGMMKKQCPYDTRGDCYWCGAPILFVGTYVGDQPGTHRPNCPWNEVIDYAALREIDRESDPSADQPTGTE